MVKAFVAAPTQCAYLPDRMASLEYRLMLDVSAEELSGLLARGFRRFGPAYFRPRCGTCAECVPLRIPVAEFRPSRSLKRVWSKAKQLTVQIGRPQIDTERLELYHRWHAHQGARRGWDHDPIDEQQYLHQFAFPHPSALELAFVWQERLAAISIVDQTPDALSAVYTFFDPDLKGFSLGSASILHQIELARRTRRSWVYLGYRVLGCPSSEYKARFRPHQLMVRWPRKDEEGEWVDPEAL